MADGPPCAGCGATLDALALVRETAFPHDDEAVIALLRGDLNRLACRRCGARTLVVTETAVVWGASGRRVELSPDAPADVQPGASGQIVRTVEELQSVVWGWFGEHSAPASSAMNSGIGADALRVDLVDTFSPLFLRAFRAGIDGLLPRTLGFANDPDATTKEGIHAIVVGSQAVRIGLLCADRRDLAALPDELSERIPRPCVTREVVDGLARRCVDEPPAAASGTDGFREAFATTIVHALLCERAGHAYERQRQLADYLAAADARSVETAGLRLHGLSPTSLRPAANEVEVLDELRGAFDAAVDPTVGSADQDLDVIERMFNLIPVGSGHRDARTIIAFERFTTALIRRAARWHEAGRSDCALTDLAVACSISLASYPMSALSFEVFTAASIVCERIRDVSCVLGLAAEAVQNVRRARLHPEDRIAFEDDPRHREASAELCLRLFRSGDAAGAVAAMDASRARWLGDLIHPPVAPPPDVVPPTLAQNLDPVTALRRGARHVRSVADEWLRVVGQERTLDGPEVMDLVVDLGRPVLFVHPIRDRVRVVLVLPSRVVLDSTGRRPLAEIHRCAVRCREFLGIVDVVRGTDASFTLRDLRPASGDPARADDGRLQKALTELSEHLLGRLQELEDWGQAAEIVRDNGLIVVPYRELALVPFSLLPVGGGSALGETAALSVVPSLAALARLRHRATMRPRAQARCYVAGNPTVTNARSILPGANDEAIVVHDLVVRAGVAPGSITLRFGPQATKASYQHDARGCRLVHLACHAAVLEPVERSGLFLASSPPSDDGILHAEQILLSPLDDAFVFLAACGTGLGRPTADGVIGLARAFMQAGARAVAMSLWSVSDEATSVLVRHFYEFLLATDERSDAASALRRASLATREALAAGAVVTVDGVVLSDHPRNWAPFVLFGDGSWAMD